MPNRLPSPSQLAARAASLKPIGEPAKAPGVCALCGYAHDVGDIVAPFVPSDTFTDFTALRGQGSRTACGWCLVTWNADFTQRYTKSIICEGGVFPAASNDHIAYWLTNPPAGEWVMMQSDQKRQHLIWRSPVNTSSEVFQLRYGELILTVRREMLAKGAAAATLLAQKASVGRRGAPLKSPFVRLSRDLDDPAHGLLRHDVYAMRDSDPEAASAIDTIAKLTPGELWGLTAVLYAANPHRPEPKLVPGSSI